MMNGMGQLFALVACLLIPACATPPAKISQEKPVDEINNRQGLALKGYDPVAYFTQQKPTPGSPDISLLSGLTPRRPRPEAGPWNANRATGLRAPVCPCELDPSIRLREASRL